MKKYILCFALAAAAMVPDAAAQTMTVNMRDGQKHQFSTADIEQVTFDVPQQNQGPFHIEVTDITSVSAKLSITPEDPNITYYFDVCDKEDYEYYGAQYVVENYFKSVQLQYPGIPLSTFLEAALSKGADCDDVSGLPADTEMVCYAIEVNSEGKCVGEASAVPFSTLPGGDPADCTFDISYSGLMSTELTVIVKPSDPSVRYWMGCYAASDWPGDLTMPQAVKASIEEYSAVYGKPIADVVRGVTFTGDINIIESGFDPNTAYYIYVYAMDDNGDAAGPLFKQRFTTASYDYSEAQISLSYRYFDGNEMADAYPDKFGDAKGKVILQAVFTPNEVAQSYAWALAKGDLTDETLYPETTTKNAVIKGGFLSVPVKNLYAQYGEATFLYFAADAYGIDGKLSRTLANITTEGVSPVSTFEDLTAPAEAPAINRFAPAKIASDKDASIRKRFSKLHTVPGLNRF